MKIKLKSKSKKKQKAYLKWMGIEIPRSKSRLPQLNKFNRKRYRPTEVVRLFQRLADREAV